MKFEVLKSFTWAGQDLVAGDEVDIPDESPKIGPLTRSRFIRYAPDGVKKELPKVDEVAQEIEAERHPVLAAVGSSSARSPKDIVREAKAKANAKR